MNTNQADEAQATETENVQDLAPDSDEGDESLWSERALDTAIDEFLDAIPLEERPGSLPLKNPHEANDVCVVTMLQE